MAGASMVFLGYRVKKHAVNFAKECAAYLFSIPNAYKQIQTKQQKI
jgi:hypothetical protein